jgi:hypothetical protein
MRRLFALAAAGVLSLAAAGCLAPIAVGSHLQPAADFSEYRTFAWEPADAQPASDPRLERNPIFTDHMYGAVERQLAVRGIEFTDSAARADLLVHYHTAVVERLDVEPPGGASSSCPTAACGNAVVDFEQCTLVLDLVDARTRQLVWRGWSEHRLEDLLANPDSLARDVDRGVAMMLARFPRRAERRLPGEAR